jgi:hypothetical protein
MGGVGAGGIIGYGCEWEMMLSCMLIFISNVYLIR